MTKMKQVPRQARSQKTKQKLLDACEQLLRDKPWREISIQQIVVKAGLSNGAVYGRFGNKDEILVCLYERHNERLKAQFASRHFRSPDPNLDLADQLGREIDLLIQFRFSISKYQATSFIVSQVIWNHLRFQMIHRLLNC